MKKTTIIDIARETGFSKSTVSRVLINGGYVKETTRKIILGAAKKLNYYPNEMARSLVSSSYSNFIGVIISDIKNPSYVDLITGIQKAIRKTDYKIILYNTDYKLEEEKKSVELIIRNRGVGAIIAAPEKTDANIQTLAKAKIPLVVWGAEVNTADADLVSVDNYGGARMAMEYLVKKGHKDIAHFAGAANFEVTESRVRAYRDVLTENGLIVDDRKIIWTDMTIESGYKVASRLEDLEKMPTAIFAYCDYVALGIMQYLHEKGYKIPDDISIVGTDDIETSGLYPIGLTTVRQPFIKIGEEIMKILENNIKNPYGKNKKQKIYIKPEFIERRTVRDIN